MTAIQSLSQKTLPSVLPLLNPVALGSNLWRHRDLIIQFVQREVQGRYRGSFFGVIWSFAPPLLLLTTYTLVFGLIFQSRAARDTQQNLSEFALMVFCGVIVFNLFSECVNRAAGLIVAVPSYVKKIVFPLEVLPVTVLGSALFHGLVGLAVLCGWVLLSTQRLPVTLLLLPVASIPLVFFSLGLSWFLAGLGVFMRDIQHVVALALQILLFGTPIFYTIEMVPHPLKTVIRLNPLTSTVDNYRRLILAGAPPAWAELAVWTIASGGVLLLGYAWFMRTKKVFADVI